MPPFIWVHEDALRDDHPVRSVAGGRAKLVFVWDADYLATRHYGMKRLTFIYECLREMDVEVYVGNTVEVLTALAQRGAIYMAETPNPDLKTIAKKLRNHCEVTIVPDEMFCTVPQDVQMKRFFRFWKQARTSALTSP